MVDKVSRKSAWIAKKRRKNRKEGKITKMFRTDNSQ